MNLEQIIQALDLTVLTNQKDFSSIIPQSGYTSDLLSCVMAGASHKSIWITLQAHTNIVAVAALLELSAVIITEGAIPDQITLDKAKDEGIILLSSKERTFTVVGKLWEMGIRGK
jgi:predicted transcriptional regulator